MNWKSSQIVLLDSGKEINSVIRVKKRLNSLSVTLMKTHNSGIPLRAQ